MVVSYWETYDPVENLDKWEVTIIYSKYTWISKEIYWLFTCLSPIWLWCWCLRGSPFRNLCWWKQSTMGPKIKQITLWSQEIKFKLVWYSKTGLEIRDCHQSQFDLCVFYIKYRFFKFCLLLCNFLAQTRYNHVINWITK